MTTDRMPMPDRAKPDRRPELKPRPERQQALAERSRPIPGTPDHRPPVPAPVVLRVLENMPFADFPHPIRQDRKPAPALGAALEQLTGGGQETKAQFLRRLFPRLTEFREVSFVPRLDAPERELPAIRSAWEAYRAAGLTAQAAELEEAYEALVTLRRLFRPGLRRQLRRRGGVLELALPMRYLPELLLAAPVWFCEPRESRTPDWLRGGRPSATEYFGGLGHGSRFAVLFQLYNREARRFAHFRGPDPVPRALAPVISEFRSRFDFLVIATPYHELAFVPAADLLPAAAFSPYEDPFLLGFLRAVPEYFFCLARWSGTGLFSLIPEMIAATLLHLRHRRERFAARRFKEFSFPKPSPLAAAGERWKDEVFSLPSLPSLGREARELPEEATVARFLNEAFAHFQGGSLFPWLRAEL